MGTRRERVILDLEDHLSSGMVKAAASTGLLNRELGSLSRDAVRTRRSVSDIDQPIQKVGRSSSSSSREVDKLSGRMRILADVAAVLGPSLVPIGAVGVPALTGLAAQMGFVATGAGVLILAFQGVGAALKAVNAAAIEPTQANLQKAEIALEGLSPAARGFVVELGKMTPEFRRLRDLAADGFFPGATEGLKSMETALPHVRALIAAVSQELGDIAADTGASLGSERWTDFLDFLAENAPEALGDMAKAAGNTAHAVAELWMATDPLNDDFSNWLVDATGRLDDFASGLSKTQGYAEFIAYVEENGPQVGHTLGAIANAALQIVEATAPLGGPVLHGIEALADVIAAVADSDLGTPIFLGAAALALFNRTLSVTRTIGGSAFGGMVANELKASLGIRTIISDLRVLNAESRITTLPGKNFIGPLTQAQTAATRLKTTLPSLGKTAALMAGVAVASSGAADKIGLTNTASLALMGTFIAPGLGTAIGGAAGLLIDLSHAGDGAEATVKRLNAATRSVDLTAMSTGIKDVTKQLDDLQNTSGFGDFLSDQAKSVGHALTHPLDLHDDRADKAKSAIANAEKTAAAIDAANRAKARSQLIHDGYGVTARNLDAATQSAQDFTNALDRVNGKLTQRSAAREYEASLDDFTKSLKENGHTLDKHTEKGRNNQAALDRIASATADLAKEMNNPTLRAEFLDKARHQFINAQVAAGKTRAEARRLADDLIGLDKLDPKINPHADTHQATSAIAALKSLVDSLHDRNIHINVTKHTNATLAEADANGADGLTIPGQRHPYGDKTLILAAPGEELITNRNGEADRFRADRAAGRIPAYADGGRVGTRTGSSMSWPAIDYDRLASAITGNRLSGIRDNRDAIYSAMRAALKETPIVQVPQDASLLYGAA